MKAVLEDVAKAPISEAGKALFAFVDTLNHRAAQVGRADIDRLAGRTDGARQALGHAVEVAEAKGNRVASERARRWSAEL